MTLIDADAPLTTAISWLSVRDVATREGVTEETVRRWISDARLAAEKVGPRWRVSELDLVAFKQREAAGELALEEPVTDGLSQSLRWLRVATSTRWAALTRCSYCTGEGLTPKWSKFRIEAGKKRRGKLVCGRCGAKILVGGPSKFHAIAWAAAPVVERAPRARGGAADLTLQLPLGLGGEHGEAATVGRDPAAATP